MKHFVAMAGLSGGYLPNYIAAHKTRRDAVDDLVQFHDMGHRRADTLRRKGYVSLSLARDGNEYAEVVVCECDDVSAHDM